MLMRLSVIIIPALIFYIVLNGVLNKTDVYDAFVKGAMDGLKTVTKAGAFGKEDAVLFALRKLKEK